MDNQRFEIIVNTPQYIKNVYLSCSWRSDEGKSASWVVVRDLDRREIRVLGDVRDQPEQDINRIKRIMKACNGFVVVFPYRDNEYTTSPFIVQELSLAIEQKLPIAVFADERVKISEILKGDSSELCIENQDKIVLPISLPFEIPKVDFFGIEKYTHGADDRTIEEQLKFKIDKFIEYLKSKPRTKEPYALIFSRLQEDFQHAHEAIRTAIENTAGIPCIWVNQDTRYSSNISGVREKTRELIRAAEFLVVDISRSAETPSAENPTLAFELGQVDYSEKSVFVSLKRVQGFKTYYAIEDMQLHFWENEEELYRELSKWLSNNTTKLGRNIYNRAEELSKEGHDPVVVDHQDFEYKNTQTYKLEVLSVREKLFLASGIAIIVGAGAQLFERYTGFAGSFDLLSILASIIAFIYGSFYANIQASLARSRNTRWLIYLFAVVTLVAFILSIGVEVGTK